MIELTDMLDADALADALERGMIKRQLHPELPLAILNYTARCQYERAWTDVTRACRGLIYHTETGALVARPWPKFYNYGEHEEGTLDLDHPVEVTDKLDGSLGIAYPDGNGWAIATRGSFTSDQARWATQQLRSRYPDFAPDGPLTVLFEVIYPENRIVCKYDFADLVLLGGVGIGTGDAYGPSLIAEASGWTGPRAHVMEARTLAEALALPPRENAEGVVIRFYGERGALVKVKQEDYVQLHRLVTGLNERTVWEHLRDGGSAAELCERLPDEFHGWVNEISGGLQERFDEVLAAAYHDFHSCPRDGDRKTFALAARERRNPSLLFLLLDGKTDRLEEAVWKLVKPDVTRTLLAVTEDVA